MSPRQQYIVDPRERCSLAAQEAARRHGIGFVYICRETGRPTGIASGVLVRVRGRYFIFTAGHNIGVGVPATEHVVVASALRAQCLRLELVDYRSVQSEQYDAAALMVAPIADETLDDIALPGEKVWPAAADARQLAEGYITVSGFPGARFEQHGASELLLGGVAAMCVRADCEDSPPSLRASSEWTVDVWIPPDGFVAAGNILESYAVPRLKGVSGGPYWLNADETPDPGLIAIHRMTVGEPDGDDVLLGADRFAHGQLVAVHLRLAADIHPELREQLMVSHPWVLGIDPYQGSHDR